MNIWFLLWVFITLFILGLYIWSIQILFRQKRTWAEVAQKHGLGFTKGTMTKSPSLSGTLKSFPVNVYSEEQYASQNGSKRYRTIIQFELPNKMGNVGVIASPDAANFARSLTIKETLSPDETKLNKNIVARAENAQQLKDFLSEEKCKSLNAVMSINGIACIFIFDENNTFIRFETPDPFDDATRLDRFLTKAVEHAKAITG